MYLSTSTKFQVQVLYFTPTLMVGRLYVKEKVLDLKLCLAGLQSPPLQHRSASLSIRAGACTDCEYIECTIVIIIIVILVQSLFLVDIMCSSG